MALFGKKKLDQENKKSVTKPSAVKSEAAGSMQDLYNETGRKSNPSTGGTVAAAGNLKLADLLHILVKPLITEKATNLVAANKYAFIVAPSANKISVAKAINAIYGVKPLSVNIINRQGKFVARGKVRGQRSDSKKAIVTLKPGDAIKIYEGV